MIQSEAIAYLGFLVQEAVLPDGKMSRFPHSFDECSKNVGFPGNGEYNGKN